MMSQQSLAIGQNQHAYDVESYEAFRLVCVLDQVGGCQPLEGPASIVHVRGID